MFSVDDVDRHCARYALELPGPRVRHHGDLELGSPAVPHTPVFQNECAVPSAERSRHQLDCNVSRRTLDACSRRQHLPSAFSLEVPAERFPDQHPAHNRLPVYLVGTLRFQHHLEGAFRATVHTLLRTRRVSPSFSSSATAGSLRTRLSPRCKSRNRTTNPC